MQRGSIAPHVWPRFNTYMINGWWWNEWINEWKSEWWLTNLYLKTIMQTWSSGTEPVGGAAAGPFLVENEAGVDILQEVPKESGHLSHVWIRPHLPCSLLGFSIFRQLRPVSGFPLGLFEVLTICSSQSHLPRTRTCFRHQLHVRARMAVV